MKHARRRLQRIARLAAVGGLLCGGLMVTSAVASEPPGRTTAGGVPGDNDLGSRLVSDLGDTRTAGTWIAADGRQVVAVTDDDAATEVKRSGARAAVVQHSMSDLRAATTTLSEAPRVPGTAWSVDYATNKVVVQADSTVSKSDWSQMTDVAEGIGGFVEMQRTPGAFTTRVNGAEPILAGNGRCSAGFNVTNGQSDFILTAGHCGPVGTPWFGEQQGSQQIGATTSSSFPGSDFSLVQYAEGQTPGNANVVNIGDGKGVQITGAADPFVGQQVFRSGSTTGLRPGRVTAVNATVNYPEGTVTGLTATTVCAEPGDSGGPLFSQGLALGVTSGGNGDCTSGGVTYFQPVTRALSNLGVALIGATAPANGAGGAQPPLDPAAVPPSTGRNSPLDPGQTAQAGSGLATFSEYLGPKGLAPGLVVLAVSLLGLILTRSIWSAQDRRRYRMHYSQSWN
ncbi:S1 family peptidase [Streptomyces sp. NPDC051907]|uniref:S1 family peptidase n=1 Tax=Streptomyces sp. NPDC051907 TaxID=3155284 RepID=UPI0034441072